MPAQMLDRLIRLDGDKPQSSYSALTLHRKCPQAWVYKYAMGLERLEDEPTPYLTIGTWWAAVRAADTLERGRKLESLVFKPRSIDAEGVKFDPETVTVTEVLVAAEKRWKGLTSDEQEVFEATLGESLPDRLQGMLRIWNEANGERFDREVPLGAEVFWKRKLPRPSLDGEWSLLKDPASIPSMSLIGFVDEVYYDRERQMVVVLDSKAQKSISSTTLDDLMDSQLMLYAWGLNPQLEQAGYSPVRVIGYDRVCSVAPRQPVLTASGTLSKSVTAYDRFTYYQWATTDTTPTLDEVMEMKAIREAEGKPYTDEQLDALLGLAPGQVWGNVGEFFVSGPKAGKPKFGVYELDEKVLESLNSPAEHARWSKRTNAPVNRRIVDAHLRSAVDTALDIYQTQTRLQISGQAARNLSRSNCQFCEYAELCRAQMFGGARGEYDLEALRLRQSPHRSKKTPAVEEQKEQEDK